MSGSVEGDWTGLMRHLAAAIPQPGRKDAEVTSRGVDEESPVGAELALWRSSPGPTSARGPRSAAPTRDQDYAVFPLEAQPIISGAGQLGEAA